MKKTIEILKKFTLPGFDKLPLYEVISIFFKGIKRGSLTLRASAVSFNFFLAVFPAIIFFFTLIPYIPIADFQDKLLNIFEEIMPHDASNATRTILFDIVTRQRGGLLSVVFLLTLFFSTNGVNSLIVAFNNTNHTIETRPWLRQRLIAILLTLILSLLVIIATFLIILNKLFVNYLIELDIIKVNVLYYFAVIAKWFIIIGLYFFIVSFLYYLAPAKPSRWRFFSAGGTVATILSIIVSILFSFYVNNFGQYNKLYGSIGAIIVLLLWLFFNSIALLIGFEINASIDTAKRRNV